MPHRSCRDLWTSGVQDIVAGLFVVRSKEPICARLALASRSALKKRGHFLASLRLLVHCVVILEFWPKNFLISLDPQGNQTMPIFGNKNGILQAPAAHWNPQPFLEKRPSSCRTLPRDVKHPASKSQVTSFSTTKTSQKPLERSPWPHLSAGCLGCQGLSWPTTQQLPRSTVLSQGAPLANLGRDFLVFWSETCLF